MADRRMGARISFFLAIVAVALTAASLAAPGGRTRPMAGPGPEDVHLVGPDLSIGEVIDDSELIVLARFVEIEDLRWNSADSTDWNADFMKDPDLYESAPVPYRRTAVRIEGVIDRTSGTPEVAEGDVLEVRFVGDFSEDLPAGGSPPDDKSYLLPGIEAAQDGGSAVEPIHREAKEAAGSTLRVLFLDLSEMWIAGPVGSRQEGSATIPVWFGDDHQGKWGVRGAQVFPLSVEHLFSLEAARDQGLLDVEISPDDGYRTITLQALEDLIEAERLSPDEATVASYEAWPWEPYYEADVKADEAAAQGTDEEES